MVLIKSVAFAIPTYPMNCFKLHVTLCREFDSLVANFWWGQKNSEKRIHWKSWGMLSMAKDEGGMGFRGLVDFNVALLVQLHIPTQKLDPIGTSQRASQSSVEYLHAKAQITTLHSLNPSSPIISSSNQLYPLHYQNPTPSSNHTDHTTSHQPFLPNANHDHQPSNFPSHQITSAQTQSHSPSSTLPHTWLAPPQGIIKVNPDGAWNSEDYSAGIGIIARDSEGKLVSGAASSTSAQSSIEVEAKATLEALSLAQTGNFSGVIFESDSQVLVNVINNPSKASHWLLRPVGTRIRRASTFFSFSCWNWIPRKANEAANCVATLARRRCARSLGFPDPHPCWLMSCLEMVCHTL
ncbi:hypothetical protein ACLB2K_072608 [Fragaria x ananassa]